MAEAATVYETVPKPNVAEEYGRSLAAMRHGGELLVEQQVSVEYLIEATEMYPDFKTAVKEMLKTDKEFGSRLELSNQREHDMVTGQVVNAKGEPMIEVLDNGRVISSLLTEQDRGYADQVKRDEADIRLAKKVDAMPVGHTLWAVSKDPAEALKKRPDIYAKRFGYKKGLVYLQMYSKVEGRVSTGSHAIDCQYPDVLREILAEHDMVITQDESDSAWLDHAASSEMSPDAADVFARSIRREYHKRINELDTRISVDEFVDEHEAVLLDFFSAYYPDMARAITTGDNQASIRELAAVMLSGNPDKLKPEIVSELIRIRNSSKLGAEAIRVLDSIVRYAVVEELRKTMKLRLLPAASNIQCITALARHPEYAGQDIHWLLATNVQEGISAGRSYSGCPGNIELANNGDEAEASDKNGINRQEAYGGQAESDADCDFISKECPECGAKNVKTTVKKISAAKKRIEGACGCTKVYKDE